MNENHKRLVVVSICLLAGARTMVGCTADLGCPEGTVQVGDVCIESNAVPDGGPAADSSNGTTGSSTSCSPTNAEICDELDNDCDGLVDEGVTSTYYLDRDGDLRGFADESVEACTVPAGYGPLADECDDDCPTCWTGNIEACDGLDNNCSGEADEFHECVQGQPTTCTTSCGTIGTGTCTTHCAFPEPAECAPPEETCNLIDDDCDGIVDDGVLAQVGTGSPFIGNDATLEPRSGGFVGLTYRRGYARLFTTDASGNTTSVPTAFESEGVVATDLSRASETTWHAAAVQPGSGPRINLVAIDGDVPTASIRKIALDPNANGFVRIASRTADQAAVVFRSGSLVKVAQLDMTASGVFVDADLLPGDDVRSEFGAAIAALPGSSGYVVAWVEGVLPTINVGRLDVGSIRVTNRRVLEPGIHPALTTTPEGLIALAFIGVDNGLRFTVLDDQFSCVGPDSETSCTLAVPEWTVVAPPSTYEARILDLVADGDVFWIAARVVGGDLLVRADATEIYDTIFTETPDDASSWVTITAGAIPLVAQGHLVFTLKTPRCPM